MSVVAFHRCRGLDSHASQWRLSWPLLWILGLFGPGCGVDLETASQANKRTPCGQAAQRPICDQVQRGAVDPGGQDLSGCRFQRAVFEDKDFSGAKLCGAIFTKATLRRVNFSELQVCDGYQPNGRGRSIAFVKSSIENSGFLRFSAQDFLFKKTRINDVEFNDVVSGDLEFEDVTLTRSNFLGVQPKSMKFRYGMIDNVRFNGGIVEVLAVKKLRMKHVNFTGCKIEHASFERVNAYELVFDSSTMTQARFSDVTLTGSAFFEVEFLSIHGLDTDGVRGTKLIHIRVQELSQLCPAWYARAIFETDLSDQLRDICR